MGCSSLLQLDCCVTTVPFIPYVCNDVTIGTGNADTACMQDASQGRMVDDGWKKGIDGSVNGSSIFHFQILDREQRHGGVD